MQNPFDINADPFQNVVEIIPAAEVAKPAFEAKLSACLEAARAQVVKSSKIIVTDPTDVEGIKQSKAYRLALKKIRCEGNQAHKDGKEDIIRAGKAIDGMKNIILQVCEPEEARLEGQEKIAERIAAERAAKLRAEREAVLVELGENPAFWGPFERFPDEDWNKRVEGVKAVLKAREEQAKREAEEAARKAKEEAEERERMRAENARLKAEADAREAVLKAEREAAEKARREAEAKAKAERDAIEAKARTEREAAEAALREERARAKAIEDAARAEAARIAQERAKAEAEARAKEEAEREAKRKAEAAPDREKLLAVSSQLLAIQLPECSSLQAAYLAGELSDRIGHLVAWIRVKAGEL